MKKIREIKFRRKTPLIKIKKYSLDSMNLYNFADYEQTTVPFFTKEILYQDRVSPLLN